MLLVVMVFKFFCVRLCCRVCRYSLLLLMSRLWRVGVVLGIGV